MRSTSVRMRVTESQAPLFVKTGVRIWNARSVPVGSKLAKLAAPVNAPDTADDDPPALTSLILLLLSPAPDCLLDRRRRCVTDIDHLVSSTVLFY